MLLYASLAACALLAALLIYRYDLYDKEPPLLLLLAFALGAAAMWLIGHIEDATLSLTGTLRREPAVIALVAATHEEAIRLLVVFALALFFRRRFNDPMDGLIYGSIIGLGMAVEESRFFMNLWRTPEGLLPPTELVRLCGHLVMGGMTCYGVGLIMTPVTRRWPAIFAATVAASLAIHFLWDFNAFAAHRTGDDNLIHNLAAAALMFAGLVLYGFLVMKSSGRSRRHFAPTSHRSLWGWPFKRVGQSPAQIEAPSQVP